MTILVLLLLAFLAGFIAYWRSTNDCGQTAAPTNPMKAIVYCDYGVANLKLEDVEKPTPADDQTPGQSSRRIGQSIRLAFR